MSTNCPFVGLRPFTESDFRLYFGRKKDIRVITANLYAARLTVVYGASGVGKSSLLRAGVYHQLKNQAKTSPPQDGDAVDGVVPVYFNSWQEDPLPRLKAAIAKEANCVLPPSAQIECDNDVALVGLANDITSRNDCDLMVILDQFEEYFLYHSKDGNDFEKQFADAVNQSSLPLSFLIAIREDRLSELDRFKGPIPSLFANYLRLEHLDEERARLAIEKPIDVYNDECEDSYSKVEIEKKLVNAVLEQVRTGQVRIGDDREPVDEQSQPRKSTASGIETPFLQLVMEKLWDKEIGGGAHKLTHDFFIREGGAQEIVSSHLGEKMAGLEPRERETAVRIFNNLVTPSGSKIAHKVRDLALWDKKSDEDELFDLMQKLCKSEYRILKCVESQRDKPNSLSKFEIYHDVLAPAILTWRTNFLRKKVEEERNEKFEQERKDSEEKLKQAKIEEERARLRAEKEARTARILKFLLIGFVIVIVVALKALHSRQVTIKELDRQKKELNSLKSDVRLAQTDAVRAKSAAEEARKNAERLKEETVRAKTAKAQAEAEAKQAKEAASVAAMQASEERQQADKTKREAAEELQAAKIKKQEAERIRKKAEASRIATEQKFEREKKKWETIEASRSLQQQLSFLRTEGKINEKQLGDMVESIRSIERSSNSYYRKYPSILPSLAKFYMVYGDIRREQAVIETKTDTQVIQHYRQSLWLWKQFFEVQPNQDIAGSEIATLNERIGSFLADSSDEEATLKEADGYFQAALKIRQTLREGSPGAKDVSISLANSLVYLGDVKFRLYEMGPARKYYAQALSLYRNAIDNSDDETVENRLQLARVYVKVGRTDAFANKLTEGNDPFEYYTDASKIISGLEETDLAVSLNKIELFLSIGEIIESNSDNHERYLRIALDLYIRAGKIVENSFKLYPENVRFRYLFGLCIIRSASIFVKFPTLSNEERAAIKSRQIPRLSQAIEIFSELIKKGQPKEDIDAVLGNAQAYIIRGELLDRIATENRDENKEGDHDDDPISATGLSTEALDYLKKGKDILYELFQHHPGDVRIALAMADGYRKHGKMLVVPGWLSSSLNEFNEASKILRDLSCRYGSNKKFIEIWTDIQLELTRVHESMGKDQEAKAILNETVQEIESRYKISDELDSDNIHSLGVGLMEVGHKLEQWPEFRKKLYRKALECFLEIYQGEKSNIHNGIHVGNLYMRIADVGIEQLVSEITEIDRKSLLEEIRSNLEQSVDVTKSLYRSDSSDIDVVDQVINIALSYVQLARYFRENENETTAIQEFGHAQKLLEIIAFDAYSAIDEFKIDDTSDMKKICNYLHSYGKTFEILGDEFRNLGEITRSLYNYSLAKQNFAYTTMFIKKKWDKEAWVGLMKEIGGDESENRNMAGILKIVSEIGDNLGISLYENKTAPDDLEWYQKYLIHHVGHMQEIDRQINNAQANVGKQ